MKTKRSGREFLPVRRLSRRSLEEKLVSLKGSASSPTTRATRENPERISFSIP
jgi:hypothetical protein